MGASPPRPDDLTPIERCRALRLGGAVVALCGALDAALTRSPARVALWGSWVVMLVAAGQLTVAAPPRARLLGAVAAVLSAVTLGGLVFASGASASPFFGALALIPGLGVVIMPDDDESALVIGVAFPAAALGVLLAEGRPAGWIALWAAPVVSVAVLAVRFSRQHRARRDQAARAAAERAETLHRLARSERELARVERLARIPLLANGVAHDLNSPLAVVCSSVAFVRSEVRGADPDVVEALADASAAATHMRRIVGDLQRLARIELEHGPGAAPGRATELALRDAVEFVAAQLPEGPAVRAEIPDGLPVPVAPRHAVIDLLVQMVRALATVGDGEIVVRAERAPGGLGLHAGRGGAPGDFAAALQGNGHLSVCEAYADGLGARFRAAVEAGELRLAAELPVLQD